MKEVWAFRCVSRVALHVISNFLILSVNVMVSIDHAIICFVFVGIFPTDDFMEMNLKINIPFPEMFENSYHQLPPLQCLPHLDSVELRTFYFSGELISGSLCFRTKLSV